MEKIHFERLVYESVNDKKLSPTMHQYLTEKRLEAVMS